MHPHNTTLDDFWRYVKFTDTCWVWTGSCSDSGYGNFCSMVLLGRGKIVRAHRFAWTVYSGAPIPDDLKVLHHCDNPPCVRPDHLFLGTIAENNLDAQSKGRTQQGVKHHRATLTDDDVIDIRSAYEPHVRTAEMLAVEYGVGVPQIRKIISRQRWKHLP